MKPYILYLEEDTNGYLCTYILQKKFPHFTGLVSRLPAQGKFYAPVTGYNLWIVLCGTIGGNLVPSYRNISDEIQDSLEGMATWYYQNIIVRNPELYKNYKINVQSTN